MLAGLKRLINENYVKLIILLGFIILIVLFLPTMMINGVPEVVSVAAQNGFVDFSDMSLKDDNKIYHLGGEWEYYPNRLLNPEDFATGNNNAKRFATFPHSWQDDTEHFKNSSGYATYRLTGLKDGETNSIGLYSRFQFGAYKIFINGMEILEIGGVSDNLAEYYLSYQSGNAYLCPADDDTFEIIIQIQNYDHVMAGFTGNVFFGDMVHVKFFTEFLLILNGIMIGFLLVLMGYFMVVYLQNRKKSLYLNFAVVTLMSLYITMTTCNEAITYSIVPLVSPHLLFKLEYITQIIAALFSTQYIVNKYMKNKTYMYVSIVVCVVVSFAIAVLPSIDVSMIRIQFQAIGMAYYVIPLILTFKAMFGKKSKTARWEFVSLILLVSGICLTKLGVMLWNCIDVFPILITLYCFIQVVVLLYSYAGIEERSIMLARLNKQAEAAMIAKNDFLALMSHEIRTPMNAIIGMSDLIQTDNLNETQKLYFRDIKNVSNSLLNIVNDILDFSKIESGKFQIMPVHFNFYPMIDNICSLFYYSAKSKGLRFESDIDITIPAVLFGDETRIRQAVSNIVSNAIKYTYNGSVKLSAKCIRDGQYIEYSVTDTGIGIKSEDMPRLFKLFEQLDREKNHSVKGTGLGLAICKQLAELMGGYVMAESEYGAGSRFSICLPLVQGDPALIEQSMMEEMVFADKAKVLVVDDNAVNITVAKGILATHRIMPDSAMSGREAIDMVQKEQYDIVFMDHMMPEMDGIEATAAIRALGGDYETLPIIALTANAVSGSREFLITSGMSDFVSKPIDRVALNNILAKWLPADIIVRESREEALSAAESAANTPSRLPAELAALAEIDGLNIEKGFSHVGNNAEIYRIALNQFVYETPMHIESLYTAASERNASTYAITVHGLKGSLNSIGAETLGDWAFALEKTAKSGDIEKCGEQTEDFARAIMSFIDILAPLLAINDTGADGEKQQASAEQLFDMLEPLKVACMLGDCATIDDIADELGGLSFGEQYDSDVIEIITFTGHMEYDKALAKVEEMLGR